ncbi:cytochrome c-type biogenesis protein CcmF [Ruminiclostridium hungatei]|uniref:Cytochrome c-type biogenesis protein CcmF n=1 Tax=Ruminiclostridium hungatei TaxID=48256 RepID=A0A1V4SMC5_RUMHU|nr:cytochrome c biogenesis protein CcsA [Ruminiclostridium hungatei]OPX45029.1 cytochrome c-type biogenesis protein CcmF [Ruminiclostridium hungatei]
MGTLGYICLISSFVMGIFCLILLKFAKTRNYGLRAGLISNAFILLTSLVLFYLLVTSDFSIEYVYKNTDRNLPLIYKISAFWSGSAGSLLLWATCISVVYIIIYGIFHFKQYSNRQYMVCLTATTIIFNLAFLTVLILVSNPFKAVGPSSNGFGLSPSLQSIGMIFHPPLVMLAYSCFFAAFSSMLYETLYPQSPELSITGRLPLLAWIILTTGIVSGGIWAYRELGWGGYWNWDPIENSALVTWLLSTAYLHMLQLKRSNAISSRPLTAVISAIVFSVLFGTGLARSGILNSVHAYSSHSSKIFFPILLIIAAAAVLAVLIVVFRRKTELKDTGSEPVRLYIYIPPFLLIVTAMAIALMTVYPLFQIGGPEITEKTYDLVFGIFGLAIILASSAIFSFRHLSRKYRAAVWAASLLSGTVTSFLPSFAAYESFTRLSLSAAVICLISLLLGLLVNINSIFNDSRLLMLFIIHLSIVLIAFGLIGTRGMKIETSSVIDKNSSISIGKYTLELDTLEVIDQPEKKTWTAGLSCWDGKSTRALDTSLHFYKKKKVYHSKEFIISSFNEELYINIENAADDGSVLLRVSLFKWFSLLWLGIILMILASSILYAGGGFVTAQNLHKVKNSIM